MATSVFFLSRYQRQEARQVGTGLLLVGLAAGLALVALTHWVIPVMPAMANTVLERAFLVHGLGAVTLLNDYLAVYMVVFFVGVTQLTRVVVTPREERQLDVLLSKPLRRTQFLAARTLPVMLSTAVLGAALGGACALAASRWELPGETVSAWGAFGACLAVTAVTLVQLALLSVVLLLVRDSFQALLVAFGVWMLPLLPASTFIYRPDVFEGHATLARYLVMPANLVWLDASMPVVGTAMMLGALLVCLLALRVAGAVFERLDI